MKKIIAIIISLTMLMSFAIGSIAGANEDAFANAVLDEQTQLALEKAAFEFANGNDTEGLAAEENAEETLAKSTIPFRNFMGAINSSHYVRAIEGCCTNPSLPTGYRVVEIPGTSPTQVIVKYQLAKWDPVSGAYFYCTPPSDSS